MYNHNKAQQSKNRVHISWDILYTALQWQKNNIKQSLKSQKHPIAHPNVTGCHLWVFGRKLTVLQRHRTLIGNYNSKRNAGSADLC